MRQRAALRECGMKRILILVLLLIVLVPLAVIGYQMMVEPGANEPSAPVGNLSEQVNRGQYLALAGDCMACHTARGGAAYAGGRQIATPFGNFISPNITPDTATGIGSWNADDFWRAMHNGKSKDGSFLYPAFPFPNYTMVTRADSDAMYAYFKSVPAVSRPNQPHALRFPYNQRILLAGWRALYFRPGVYQPDSKQSAEWNRGAYLVQGLGHCNACHSNRNVFGATQPGGGLAGGLIPIQNWYAPALNSDAETGLGEWPAQHIAELLKTGVAERSAVYGPMAEVVRRSLQHLSDSDIDAMAGYLKSVPKTEAPQTSSMVRGITRNVEETLKLGSTLYEKHCAECHKTMGEGVPRVYPPLAANRSITGASAINPIRMVLNGGYPPSTAGNPRPFGMPPFGPFLSDTEVAAVVTYVRNSWGNSAPQVAASEVNRYRTVPLD
jgi:mono/diheme cytochrome c family protein